MYPAATHARRLVALPTLRVPVEIPECDVGDLHLGGSGEGAVVAVVLRDGGPRVGAVDEEVFEEEIKRHRSPHPRHRFLGIVPGISIPVYAADAVAVDGDAGAGEDEVRGVVLEGDRVRVGSPVVEVV
ncbi:hypothetical protein HYALB_00005194 [Hymenoscyphus albidus]|uniref:Uncharacterized protein n=1 Tax=Hymenoscyphus albidus TaxID=595503 RepID=A0A9N9LVT0_9HELO|nr:hypothetical protein HYALB_00005194 [Hymenoscyphus albidus]